MTCVFLKKGDCSGYDMRLEWKSLLESTHSSNFSLRLNRENSKSWNSSILSMLRGSILQHSKLECPARLASCLCTLCFWTKLNFNRAATPLRGEGRGRKEKGGGRKGPAPGGPCAQRIPSPPSSPPWVPGTRPEIPLFVFFFFLFRLNLSSAARLLSFHFLLSTFTFSRFTLQRVASQQVTVRSHFKMLHHSR